MLNIKKRVSLGLLLAASSHAALASNTNPIDKNTSDFRGQILIQIEGEDVYQKSFGQRGSDDTQPIDDKTLFYIGSIAKTFTSTVMLQLDNEDQLSLDDPIGEYIENVPSDKKGITIRNLLSHISGLVANHENPLVELDKDEFIEWALGTELEAEPGTQWSYSNVGYGLLATIIEQVESKPFRQVIHDRIFDPAGMKNALYFSELTGDEHIAIGYGPMADDFKFNGDVRSLSPTWLRMGAGGILCTAQDLAAFHQALHNETLLSIDQQKLAGTPVANRYGLGWRTATSSRGTPTMYHDGAFPGFNAEFFRLPIEDVCIIILAADEQAAHEMRNTVLEYAKELFED